MMGPGIGHDVMRRLDIAGVFALIVGTMPSFTRFSTAASNAGVHYSWSVQPPQRELCRGQFFRRPFHPELGSDYPSCSGALGWSDAFCCGSDTAIVLSNHCFGEVSLKETALKMADTVKVAQKKVTDYRVFDGALKYVIAGGAK